MLMLTLVLAMYFFIAIGLMEKGRAVGFNRPPLSHEENLIIDY